MAGALAERDFVDKLARAGFAQIDIVDRQPVSVDVLGLYPLVPSELLTLMRRLVPEHRHGAVAMAVVVGATAR